MSTDHRKVNANDALSQEESELALGIARLVSQVEQIVRESGESQGFDATTWTAAWLRSPNRALAGKAPDEFMGTADGRLLVSGLIAQMQSAAYA